MEQEGEGGHLRGAKGPFPRSKHTYACLHQPASATQQQCNEVGRICPHKLNFSNMDTCAQLSSWALHESRPQAGLDQILLNQSMIHLPSRVVREVLGSRLNRGIACAYKNLRLRRSGGSVLICEGTAYSTRIPRPKIQQRAADVVVGLYLAHLKMR